ncbi:hypothetical protein MJO28_000685 [Puccinia striiformis f. sp. tritici]|uniref:Uncharacterized protein n=1 Tax=Puccinia striiformis f. sp. tritici TaxID=168172 RepID=A0ACC0EYJ9_9BASI|nr:hypothetical protein MJO28_000685 [Puccinia striiformis f. sp. tritici]
MDVSMESNSTGFGTQTTMEGRYTKFLGWLTESRGVILETNLIQAHNFVENGEGWGMIAITDIKKGTNLFSIPRRPGGKNSFSSPLLSVQSSTLLSNLNTQDRLKISRNWIPLLLVLLYERVQAILDPTGSRSWAPYFDTLPQEFDTLMFWSPEELAELTGSTITEKIGKEEAEKDYFEVIKPLIESRADIFVVPEGTSWETNYGISRYHQMGSLILSRSFHVEASSEIPTQEEDISMDSISTGHHSVHDSSLDQTSLHSETLDDDQDEEEREAVQDIALVPLADLLNAKTGSENAKLFYEIEWLKMNATRNIKKGEQIYNTYGDPPNADLLRRYGHVDVPNRYDVVEISIKTCLEVVASSPLVKITEEESQERLDWALEMGIDDVFEIPTELERKSNGDPLLPEELTCILQIFLLTKPDFEDHKSKEKLPKPKLNSSEVIILAQQVVERRMKEYPTSIEEDESLLARLRSTNDHRKIKAIIVRKSEKQILVQLLDSLALKLTAFHAKDSDSSNAPSVQKRKPDPCNQNSDLKIRKTK